MLLVLFSARDSYLAEFGILEITLLKDNQLRLVYLGYILVIIADLNMNCMILESAVSGISLTESIKGRRQDE